MAVKVVRAVVPVMYDVDEAAEALRLSRSLLYELIRSGRLRTVTAGRRRAGSGRSVGGVCRISERHGMTERRARGDGGLHWDEKRQRWIATAAVGYDGRGKRIVRRGSGRNKTEAKDKLKQI